MLLHGNNPSYRAVLKFMAVGRQDPEDMPRVSMGLRLSGKAHVTGLQIQDIWSVTDSLTLSSRHGHEVGDDRK
jgi:hypothetical protein